MRKRSRKRRQAVLVMPSIEPIIRLWILRLLIPLECHRQFIQSHGFVNDELAELLGLQVAWELLDEAFNGHDIRAQIKRIYDASEMAAADCVLPHPLADNIRQLSAQVGLSKVESSILAFSVLVHSDRLLNEVTDWLGMELNTLKVYYALSVLLGFPEAEIREALSMNSVLSRTSLVVLNRHHSRVLDGKLDVLSGRFAEYLISERGAPVNWLRDMIVPSQPPQLGLHDYPYLNDTLDYLLPYLQQSMASRRLGVNVFFYGPPGTGKTQLARILSQQLACPLYEVASEDDDGNPVTGEKRLRAYRAGQAFFHQKPCLMLFDEVEDVFNDGSSMFGMKSTAQIRKAWMNRLLEENPGPTLWLGNSIASVDPAFIRRFDWVVELPIPPRAQREQIFRNTCGTLLTERSIKRLAASEELAPAVVTRAVQVIGTLQGRFSTEQLSGALEQLMDKTLIAQGHKGLHQNQALALPECYDPELINCDADLTQIAEGIQHYGGARLCLYGPPGTGKSAYSRWLAEQLGKPLHLKRGSDLLSMWVGGTEKNMARVFEKAEQDNAVLMIDEIDSFLQRRENSSHGWEITAVNEMLTRLESFNGVLIASTNRLEGLDAAALRRFDLKVKFDALQPLQAWALFRNYCHNLGQPEPELSLQQQVCALEGLTPGDFAVVARQHRFRPVKSAAAMLDALRVECALKTPRSNRPIGFV